MVEPSSAGAVPDRDRIASSGSDSRTDRQHRVFRDDDGVHGDELWKSDGTATGTVLSEDTTPALELEPVIVHGRRL